MTVNATTPVGSSGIDFDSFDGDRGDPNPRL